jgi:hypothetical protein
VHLALDVSINKVTPAYCLVVQQTDIEWWTDRATPTFSVPKWGI